jgi:hypothetical protein
MIRPVKIAVALAIWAWATASLAGPASASPEGLAVHGIPSLFGADLPSRLPGASSSAAGAGSPPPQIFRRERAKAPRSGTSPYGPHARNSFQPAPSPFPESSAAQIAADGERARLEQMQATFEEFNAVLLRAASAGSDPSLSAR